MKMTNRHPAVHHIIGDSGSCLEGSINGCYNEMSWMKKLLAISGFIEIPTGIALLAIPAKLAAILLGIDLETPADLGLARLAGAAVLSLGLCCWFGSRDTQSGAALASSLPCFFITLLL